MSEKNQLWLIIIILLGWQIGSIVDSSKLHAAKEELRAIHKTLRKSESGAVYNEIRAMHETLTDTTFGTVHRDIYCCTEKCKEKK